MGNSLCQTTCQANHVPTTLTASVIESAAHQSLRKPIVLDRKVSPSHHPFHQPLSSISYLWIIDQLMAPSLTKSPPPHNPLSSSPPFFALTINITLAREEKRKAGLLIISVMQESPTNTILPYTPPRTVPTHPHPGPWTRWSPTTKPG